ncbi:hypothetical protein PpBr36_07618 [Pyricularia pennisetigena]|uniref:hypothetical protein n=1 Tax=Pyricularia pennisetigena TaxID=1578925 RepID=UPI001150532D|nr:hypothetical protein PpBr36_07618 [Pyricularia pennisetigena]TLS25658.1 hypothetical protein PpBr36_07618 [Pyricularia pennisetigena]
MGLAAPKNKRKLGNDPNNTKWSRNTENFGHRMLRSQGWEPGQYLGPQDASHAVYHTAASASHIKVALKEDNLGLGAKMNRGDECTGLNAFKEMLARLNGKSEAAIEKDKKAREAHAMNVYVERKFGTMRFVSGGFLVGDVIREKNEAEVESTDATPEPAETSLKKEKKRKAGRDDDDEAQSKEERRRAKKQKKSMKETVSGGDDVTSEEDSAKYKSKKDHKSKKEKKRRKEEPASDEQEPEDEESREKRRKREKKERKERRREKREKKLKKKQQREEDSSSSEANSDEETTTVDTGASTPVASGTSTPVSQVSVRHLARRRFIAQKRMALKDQQALNQIFMIKSS